MYIIQSIIFKFDTKKYYNFNSQKQEKINYIALFMFDVFPNLQSLGITNFIHELNSFEPDGIEFELVGLDVDQETDLIYISETYNDYKKRAIQNSELNNLMNKVRHLELCKKELIKYAVMTKENFIHLLLKWEQLITSSPLYILLYLDEKDWYETLSFDSQDAIEQFITQHIQK